MPRLFDYEQEGVGWVDVGGRRYPDMATYYRERHEFVADILHNAVNDFEPLENEIYEYIYKNS